MRTVNINVAEKISVTNESDGYKVEIRRFPLSGGMFAPNDNSGLAKMAWQRFNYSVTNWEGLEDQDKNVLTCDEDNKKLVFDFDLDLLMWITGEINKLDVQIDNKKK